MFRFLFLGIVIAPLFAGDLVNSDLPGNLTIRFQEDLIMGGQLDDPHYFWASGQSPILVASDSRGNIYVGDTKDNRLLVFDAEGQFVRQIGGEGQGPGEYEKLHGFQIFQDDSAVGFQVKGATSMFCYYGANGELQSQERRHDPWSIAEMHFSPNHRWSFAFIFNGTTRATKMRTKHVLMDEKMQVVRQLGAGWIPTRDRSRYGDPSYWEEQIAEQFRNRFSSRPMAAFCADGTVLIGNAAIYKVEKWNATLSKLLWRMEKKYKPILMGDQELSAFAGELKDLLFRSLPEWRQVITSNVVNRGVAKAGLSGIKQAIFDIIPMEDSHFLVVHDYYLTSKKTHADYYDGEGHFLGKVALPDRILWNFNQFRFFFKNGFAYAGRTSEDGENQVVRYRYTVERTP